jgi:hypothetical protein
MNTKRILLSVTGILVSIFLIFSWVKYNEGGPVPYPINLGSFFTIGSTTIDPATLLEDIQGGKGVIILEMLPDTPENPPFIMSVGWSQSDYLVIANAFHKVIWKDDPNEWHLYRALFHTGCENASGEFESADLYYYQEVSMDGKRKYSVRIISIEPQYGYVAWGGDTLYPRPFWGWTEIDLENIKRTAAERALQLAEQQGGSDIRKEVDNACHINVSMWPWGYERDDWSVYYGGNTDITNGEFWIPSN